MYYIDTKFVLINIIPLFVVTQVLLSERNLVLKTVYTCFQQLHQCVQKHLNFLKILV